MRNLAILGIFAIVCFFAAEVRAAQPDNSTWTGRWSSQEGFVFDFEMDLSVDNGNVSGQIAWTLKVAPAAREDYANRIGASGVEHVTGNFSPSTGKLTLTGNSVSDETLLGKDEYSIDIANDEGSFSGVTKGSDGSWQNAIRGTLNSGSLGRMKPSDVDAGDDSGADRRGSFAPGSLTRIADSLAADSKYQLKGGQTFCSDFVRDFSKELTGQEIAELKGRAGQQYDQLTKASASTDGAWRSLSVQTDPSRAFKEAQDLANDEHLVIVAWKNPSPTKTNSGHIAVVVKHDWNDSSISSKWGRIRVPFIAQAGEEVFALGKLSEGFGPNLRDQIDIFVLK